jgi:poly(hydroxyalkanoate) granule-associated protein
MILDPAMNIARKGVLAYIGALALTGDQVAQTLDRMAKRGEQASKDVRTQMQRTLRTVREELVEGREQVADARFDLTSRRDQLLETLNIPSQTAVLELNTQVARLAAQIDELRGTLRRREAQVPTELLPGYEKLNADTIIDRLPKLEEPALLAVRAYEQQHANRVTVLRAVERALVEHQAARGALGEPAAHTTVEPLPRYDELRAEEIVERLGDLGATELLHVRTYEQEHQARVTVLRAIEERLAAKTSA